MNKFHQIIQELLDGNQRFLAGQSALCRESSLEKLRHYAKQGQKPKAVILCCSDSRAPAEMIFDQDIGDLFIIRVAGNIVAPSLVGSIEFAIASLETQLIVVMGHTQCGAIRATLDHIEHTNDIATANLHDIISRIKPHIFDIGQNSTLSRDAKMNRAVEANVHASVHHLSHASRLIEERLAANEIHIVGAVLDLHTGRVTLCEELQ